MPFTIPPSNKVAGVSTGLTTDLDNLYAATLSIASINILNAAYAGGADPTGVADSTAAINAALAAVPAGGGQVNFPAGTYKVSATLQVQPYTLIQGAGSGSTIIQTANAANLAAVMATAGWTTSSNATSKNPIYVRDITIDGNTANQSSGLGHGLVSQNYISIFERLIIQNTRGDGLRLDKFGADGVTAIGNSCVEIRVEHCQFRGNGGRGMATNDSLSTPSITDGFCLNNTVQNCLGAYAIYIASAGGWKIDGNHMYGIPQNAIGVGRASDTKIVNNEVETWGTSAGSGFYNAIDFSNPGSADVGFGTVVAQNILLISTAPGNAGSTLTGISFQAASGVLASASIYGNLLMCGQSSGAAGYYGINLQNQSAGSSIVAVVSGNTFTGTWTQQMLLQPNGGVLTHTPGIAQQSIVLGSPFTSGTGVLAQTVTGMACSLVPGQYLLRGWFPYVGAGVVGSTQTFAWTFGGTISAAVVMWQFRTVAYTAPVYGTAITTTSGLSPTVTATETAVQFEATVTVTAVGTLQLTVQSTTSGDEITLPAGACLQVLPVS